MSVPEQMIMMGPFVFLYTVFSLWLVGLTFWLEVMSKKNVRFLRIISAAVLLSASVSAIDLFL